MRTLLLGSNPLIAASILLAFGSVTAHAGDNSWAGSVTAVFQGVDDSGVDSEFTASADLFITLPMSNGEWLLYIEGSTSPNTDGVSAVYPTANADAGTVLARDGNGRVQVSEFHYTFHKHDSGRFMVGLVNPSAWLDRSRITNDENTHFINANFKNNATIEFPDYAPGAVLRWLGSEAHPEVTVVLSSSHGIADLPDRSYPDVLDIFSGGRGAFVGADARWERKQTSLRLGSWVRTDEHPVADTPGDSEMNYGEMNYGIYSVLGWGGAEDAVSVRVGLANDDVAAATHFAAVAYERSTRIGLFGLGVASTRIADSLARATRMMSTLRKSFFAARLAPGTLHRQFNTSRTRGLPCRIHDSVSPRSSQAYDSIGHSELERAGGETVRRIAHFWLARVGQLARARDLANQGEGRHRCAHIGAACL